MTRLVLALLLALALPARAVDFSEFGGACDGVADDTLAWNAAMAAIAKPASDRLLRLPAGHCRLCEPDPIPASAGVIGQGHSATKLRRTCWSPRFIEMQGQGGRLEYLNLWTDAGVNGGTALYAESTNAQRGGYQIVKHVEITGDGVWGWTVDFNSTRTIPPLGIRQPYLSDVSVFNGTDRLFNCWNCIGMVWRDGGAFQGAGTARGIVIGGPDAAANRVDAIVDWGASIIYPEAMR